MKAEPRAARAGRAAVTPVRVVLVDDQSLVRVGIAALLTGDAGGRPHTVVGGAADGRDGWAFFNNDHAANAPRNARLLIEMLGDAAIPWG